MSTVSDTEQPEFPPVPLADIPKHTWEIVADGQKRTIECHMCIRPDESINGWKFIDFIENEDGDRTEHFLWIVDPVRVSSLVLVRPDGTRKEMVGAD